MAIGKECKVEQREEVGKEGDRPARQREEVGKEGDREKEPRRKDVSDTVAHCNVETRLRKREGHEDKKRSEEEGGWKRRRRRREKRENDTDILVKAVLEDPPLFVTGFITNVSIIPITVSKVKFSNQNAASATARRNKDVSPKPFMTTMKTKITAEAITKLDIRTTLFFALSCFELSFESRKYRRMPTKV